MKLKIVISIVALLVCTNNIFQCVDCEENSQTSRKVDHLQKVASGWVVDIKEYPFMLSVQFNFKNKCSGTLIHPTWVLTAGTCLAESIFKPNKHPYGVQEPLADAINYTVVAGLTAVSCADKGEWPSVDEWQNDPNRRQVLNLKRHEDFSSVTNATRYWNDIGLMELESSFGEDTLVAVGYLVPTDFEEPAVGVAAGWGFEPKTPADTYNAGQCANSYQDLKGIYVAFTNRSFCTGKGANLLEETSLCVDLSDGDTSWCSGDQGGPLILQDGTSRVMGVASHAAKLTPCSENTIVVYSRVAKYREWIEKFVPIGDRVPNTKSHLKPSLIFVIISILALLILKC